MITLYKAVRKQVVLADSGLAPKTNGGRFSHSETVNITTNSPSEKCTRLTFVKAL